MGYQERTYHGLQGRAARPTVSRVTGRWARRGALAEDSDEWHPSRVLVEVPASGPTAREKTEVLRLLSPPEECDFGWGYNGHGTSHTAAAVLADALDVDIETIAFVGSRPDKTLADLREDFCAEVLTDLCDEWRLNRRAILRWTVGWYAKYGLTKAPPILIDPEWTGE